MSYFQLDFQQKRFIALYNRGTNGNSVSFHEKIFVPFTQFLLASVSETAYYSIQ